MVEFSISSSFEPTDLQKHHHTPKKAAVLGTLHYLQDHHLRVRKGEIFHYFHVPQRTGFRWLAENEPRRLHNRPDSGPDPRGRPRKLTREDLQKMEDILAGGFHGRILNWQQLAAAAGISEVSYCTICQSMQDLDYHSCIACDKSWISPHMKEQRVDFSCNMLQLRPKPDDWKDVQFSDEVHFGLGPQRKLRIIRQPGERYCADCIQEQGQPDEKDLYRIHAWGIVGWNYKKLFLYETGNKNGKMNQTIYTQLLSMIEQDLHGFVLEEDNDSGHTGAMTTRWKKEHGIQYYLNSPKSPDLSLIENVWQPLKFHYNSEPHWDEEQAKQRILHAFDHEIKQEWINKLVLSMPQRLQDCLARHGALTGW